MSTAQDVNVAQYLEREVSGIRVLFRVVNAIVVMMMAVACVAVVHKYNVNQHHIICHT